MATRVHCGPPFTFEGDGRSEVTRDPEPLQDLEYGCTALTPDPVVRPGSQCDGGADRADAGLLEQDGAHRGDELAQLFEVGGKGLVERGDVDGEGAQLAGW
jgi:hypothetical protein